MTVLATSLAFASCASHPKKSEKPAPAAVKSAAALEAEKAAAAAKEKEKKVAEGSVVCKNAQDERSLTVAAKDEGCELQYLKHGNSQAIASSVSGKAHCESVRDRVQKNLESAGFTCQ